MVISPTFAPTSKQAPPNDAQTLKKSRSSRSYSPSQNASASVRLRASSSILLPSRISISAIELVLGLTNTLVITLPTLDLVRLGGSRLKIRDSGTINDME